MKKIKVLQVIAELGDGGVESMLMNVYKNINKDKYTFIFLVQNENRRYEKEIVKYGGKVIEIEPLRKSGVFNYIKNIRRICKEENIEVIHCHNLTQNPIILFSGYLAGVKNRISHSHLTTCFSNKTKAIMPIIRFLINLLATTKIACGYDAGKFLYGNSKFEVINNAIDIDKFQKNYTDTKDKIKEKFNNRFIILHIGRYSEQKNHKYLINIMESLKDNNVVCLCCGTGPLEEDIRKMIKDKKLENNIFILGSRDDIPQLMSISNIMILPSLYEGLPVSLIESQASGLKAIVSDTIDKNCDLGLGLIDFLPIGEKNEIIWADKIKHYMLYGYKKPENIKEVLTENGYNGKINCNFLDKIYSQN